MSEVEKRITNNLDNTTRQRFGFEWRKKEDVAEDIAEPSEKPKGIHGNLWERWQEQAKVAYEQGKKLITGKPQRISMHNEENTDINENGNGPSGDQEKKTEIIEYSLDNPAVRIGMTPNKEEVPYELSDKVKEILGEIELSDKELGIEEPEDEAKK